VSSETSLLRRLGPAIRRPALPCIPSRILHLAVDRCPPRPSLDHLGPGVVGSAGKRQAAPLDESGRPLAGVQQHVCRRLSGRRPSRFREAALIPPSLLSLWPSHLCPLCRPARTPTQTSFNEHLSRKLCSRRAVVFASRSIAGRRGLSRSVGGKQTTAGEGEGAHCAPRQKGAIERDFRRRCALRASSRERVERGQQQRRLNQ
jgi:hypothetical protein